MDIAFGKESKGGHMNLLAESRANDSDIDEWFH
jgi:hypothetical protein